MNKINLSVLALSLVFMAQGSAFANEGKEHHGEGNGPCKQLMKACEGAGFVKGGHKENNKGLWVDCMQKLKNGESVPGVSVSAEQVNACKEKAAKHKEHKKS